MLLLDVAERVVGDAIELVLVDHGLRSVPALRRDELDDAWFQALCLWERRVHK